MTRVNLAALAAKYDITRWRFVVHHNGQLLAPDDTPGDVATLIAELRAAREVVEASREAVKATSEFDAAIDELRVAVVAYDLATGGGS